MKIQALQLTAFGPFTARNLSFDVTTSRLHIVYGPNEAGKSSSLRGLKALLYGVEERTQDNFLHANDKLRIGGHIRNTKGQELIFVRRKGRKNTLLTAQGEILEEQALTPFLQGVSRAFFATLFGIDHQALLQGGQEILAQKGEVGQALFSAAIGSATLHTVLEKLDTEADGLFRSRGSKYTINVALKEFNELKNEIKRVSLSSSTWEEHHHALARTSKDLDKIQVELASKRLAVNRLQRIQRVLPKLARRQALQQEIALLQGAILLASDFSKKRSKAMQALETAQTLLDKANPQLVELKKQLECLSTRQNLLDQAESIENLHAGLGSHRKAQQDRPHLVTECQQLESDAVFLLKEIRPDLSIAESETLRPILAKRQAIQTLGNQHALLLTQVTQTQSNQKNTENRLQIATKEQLALPQAGSSQTVTSAMVAARKLGNIDDAIQSLQQEHTSLQRQCDHALTRLTLWAGSLAALPSLGLPTRESLLYFERAYEQLAQRNQQIHQKQDETANALQEVLLRLEEMQNVGEVPTEAALESLRTTRNQVWQALRQQWLSDEKIENKTTIADTFENHLGNTDKLSDRLRREADRVHTLANLQAKQHDLQEKTSQTHQQQQIIHTEQAQLDAKWQDLWAGCEITPRTPREMRDWQENVEKLRDQVERLQMVHQHLSEHTHLRTTHIQQLSALLTALGKNVPQTEILDTVLLQSETTAQQLDAITQQSSALAKEIKELKNNLSISIEEHSLAQKALDQWQDQWQTLLAPFGLPDHTSPSETSEFIETLRSLFNKQSEAKKIQIRIQAIDKDALSFRQQVAHIATNIAPELAAIPAEEAVAQLMALLAENRQKKTQSQQLEKQVTQVQQEIQKATATVQSTHTRLTTLCTEAQCTDPRQLEEIEQKSALYLRLKEKIALVTQEIIETGEGASTTELESEAAAADPDTIPGQIEALRSQINDELEPKRTELAQSKGREEKELELMDGSDKAAALADQAQTVLASIRTNAERYVRVKIASRVLRNQIEQYRKENQGPLVSLASQHFAKLTLGSFSGLMTDFSEKDEPILTGLRPEGERVQVEGMSIGTRDQLYLALRLASLEKYMESAEPMPFIVDDILVDFDDQRAAAALQALATLAQKTQVILFTHHARVVEQAEKLAAVQVHTL